MTRTVAVADPLTGVVHMLSHPFLVHAITAGTAIALVSGLVGYFVVLRGQVFVGDALSHVAYAGALAALAADQIKQRRAGPHLHERQFLEPALDLESQGLFVEAHHRREIAHPEHDMIDSFDTESHGD